MSTPSSESKSQPEGSAKPEAERHPDKCPLAPEELRAAVAQMIG